MLKGASKGLLKVVEREMHEAWRKGYQEGRDELAQSTVPDILAARFGEEVREAAKAATKFTEDDRLAEVIVCATICSSFDDFFFRALSPKRKRRR